MQLASNNLVQLGLTVVLSDKSIRTRYVRYSRLAGGEVSISLPEVDAPQFLPVAIIEAPSTIPYCGNFTISGAKSQHGGSRGLEYKWTVGTDYNENGTLIQDSVLADYIPTGFTHQSLLELSSDLFNPDLLGSGSGITPITLASSFDTQLDVRNFLGFTSTAHIANLTRAELQLPSVVIIGGDVRRIRISDETILEGRIVLPDGCPIEEEFMTRVTYAWRVADQFNTGVTFVDPSRSSLLVLPPNLLEMGSEYTATLSVGFGTLSAVVEGSVRLVTGVELVARLANGVKRSVGVNEDISLDGRTSQFINTSSAMLGISWKCGMIDSIDNCIDRHGQYLTLSNDSLVQIIPSGMLLPGEYNFTLTLNVVSNSDILEASTYQIVVIFPFMVPRVKIVPDLGTDLESVLVQNELILNVQVQSDTPGTAQWTSEYVIGELHCKCCYSRWMFISVSMARDTLTP